MQYQFNKIGQKQTAMVIICNEFSCLYFPGDFFLTKVNTVKCLTSGEKKPLAVRTIQIAFDFGK